MNGWVENPYGDTPGWWLWAGSDAAVEQNWTQTPGSDAPEGFDPDPKNTGWYVRTGGDAANQTDWWSDSTVGDTPKAMGLVRGIDVSNAQPQDLTALIRKVGAQHVVCKLYQTVEVRGSRDHAKAQISVAQSLGCSVGGYVWLYSSVNPDQQVADALSLAAEAGIVLPVLWVDVEPYTDGSLPSVAQIAAAVKAAENAGQRVGIYTGKWVWDRLGNPQQFSDLPLWHAEYDHTPSLKPVNYGGWSMPSAWQFDDKAPDGSPLDMDVFDASVTG